MKHPTRYLTIIVILLAPLQPALADPATLGNLSATSAKAEEAKDYPTAIARMKEFEKTGGDAFYAALRLGWLHHGSGDYSAALRYYRKAVTCQPGSLNARLGVFNAATALKDPRRTAQAAAAVLDLEPTNYVALMGLAGLHFAQRQYSSAAADYSRVLVSYPDDPDALSGAAWSALHAGDKAAARERFDLLLGRDPAYPKAADGRRQAAP